MPLLQQQLPQFLPVLLVLLMSGLRYMIHPVMCPALML